jgi:hypothetical protein
MPSPATRKLSNDIQPERMLNYTSLKHGTHMLG